MIMNISRVAAGVHRPFDVLAGTLVGILGAMLSFRVVKRYKYLEKFNAFLLRIAHFFKL